MLDIRIAWVMLPSFRELSMETAFTLPKPLVHLYCHLVNVVFIGSTKGGRDAYIDLRSILQTRPSDFIPYTRNIAM